jgi:hypothetical protein
MSKRKSKSPDEDLVLRESAVAYRAETSETDYRLRTKEDKGWDDFREQCRRQMGRPIEDRIKYGFCRMYKPVLDDAPWRVFNTMEEYRTWCEENLPDYLGFKRIPE